MRLSIEESRSPGIISADYRGGREIIDRERSVTVGLSPEESSQSRKIIRQSLVI